MELYYDSEGDYLEIIFHLERVALLSREFCTARMQAVSP